MKGAAEVLQWLNSMLTTNPHAINYPPVTITLCTVVLILHGAVLWLEYRKIEGERRTHTPDVEIGVHANSVALAGPVPEVAADETRDMRSEVVGSQQ